LRPKSQQPPAVAGLAECEKFKTKKHASRVWQPPKREKGIVSINYKNGREAMKGLSSYRGRGNSREKDNRDPYWFGCREIYLKKTNTYLLGKIDYAKKESNAIICWVT